MVDADRVPTVAQLRGLVLALKRFISVGEPKQSEAWYQEECVLPSFLQVAEALAPLRSLRPETVGWPDSVAEWLPGALGDVCNLFDAITRVWGWQNLLRPEAERAAYRAERATLFRKRYLVPIQTAARSHAKQMDPADRPAGLEELCAAPPPIDFNPLQLHFPDAGFPLISDRLKKKARAPRWGRIYPTLEPLNDTPDKRQPAVPSGERLKKWYYKLKAAVDKSGTEELPIPTVPEPPPPTVRPPLAGKVSSASGDETPLSTEPTPAGKAMDASGKEGTSPRARSVNLGDNAGTKGQRREDYHCSQIVIQGEDDSIITVCHLVSWLGRVLSSPPPDYAAAWWESERTALNHSADVADMVCGLWNRLHTDPALTEAQLPPGAATAIDSLRDLVMAWAERWGLPQSPSGVSIWSKRYRRGAGDLITGGGMTIDTGPPLIELRPGEHDRLLWVFRKLEKIGLAIRQRQQVLSGTPAPTSPPSLAANDVNAPASPRGEASAPTEPTPAGKTQASPGAVTDPPVILSR
jgi:hypothetical protein